MISQLQSLLFFTILQLLFAAVLADISETESSVGRTVSYQVHSFNDIRQWPQLYSKGVQYMKIDPQYADSSFCASQTRTNASDPRGCLLLNHDSLSSDRTDYNTTSDVLDFISNIDYANWFRDASSVVYISLCFKGCGSDVCPCDHSESSTNWLSLVDEFVENANKAVADNNLNVEFLLDGNGKPGVVSAPCLNQRWRPWQAVYITGNQPEAAFYENSEEFGWDRLVCLNEAQKNWAFAVDNDYGKFKNGTFPYLVWEPSDQPTILSDIDMYINHSLESGDLHEAGMRFAINIDPAQYETYAGSRTGRSWDEVVVPFNLDKQDSSKSKLSVHVDNDSSPSHPKISVVESSSEAYAFIAVLLWSNQEEGSTIEYEILGFNGTGVTTTADPTNNMLLLGEGSIDDFIEGDSVEQSLFVSTFAASNMMDDDSNILVSISAVTLLSNGSHLLRQAMYDIIESSSTDKNLFHDKPVGSMLSLVEKSINADILMNDNVYGVSLSTVDCNQEDRTNICNAVIWSPIEMGDDQCALYMHVTEVSSNTSIVPSTCLVNMSTTITTTQYSTPSFSREENDFMIASRNMSIAAAQTGEAGTYNFSIAVMYDMGGIVYGASSRASSSSSSSSTHVCVNCLYATKSSIPEESYSNAPLQLYVGSSPSISLKVSTEGEVSVFGVSSYGYCTNSESHNKNAHVGLCDQVPERNSGGQYLNYYYGTFAAWTKSLNTASSSSTGYAGSPCSHLIASGMFGMGNTPSTAMWILDPSGFGSGSTTNGELWQAVVTYVGINEDAQDPSSCGVANASPQTIKFASWPMAQNYFLASPFASLSKDFN